RGERVYGSGQIGTLPAKDSVPRGGEFRRAGDAQHDALEIEYQGESIIAKEIACQRVAIERQRRIGFRGKKKRDDSIHAEHLSANRCGGSPIQTRSQSA